MQAHRAVPLLFLALFVAGSPAGAQTLPAVDELRLGPGDMVRIEAFLDRSARPMAETLRTDGLGDYLVDARGFVLIPVLGMLRVAGRPFGEVRQDVEAAYGQEYVDARVRVTPLLRIALLGEVRAPGLLPVDPTMTLADVVAAAGGLNPTADRGDIRLIRGDTAVLVAAEGELASLSVPLQSGDRIVVGRRSWASENLPFLLGAGASVVAAVLTALIVR